MKRNKSRSNELRRSSHAQCLFENTRQPAEGGNFWKLPSPSCIFVNQMKHENSPPQADFFRIWDVQMHFCKGIWAFQIVKFWKISACGGASFPRFARILVPGLPPRLKNSDVPPNFRASRGSAVSLKELVVPSLAEIPATTTTSDGKVDFNCWRPYSDRAS